MSQQIAKPPAGVKAIGFLSGFLQFLGGLHRGAIIIDNNRSCVFLADNPPEARPPAQQGEQHDRKQDFVKPTLTPPFTAPNTATLPHPSPLLPTLRPPKPPFP